jgi:predicted transposase/invertase (TIGR01784 family)
MSQTPKPHDNFFRENFGQAEVARDYLQNYLSAPLLAHLDLSRMALQDGSFVDPDLQESYSDLLYLVPLQNGDEAFAYFLFEHKSFPDKQVAFQLLRYMVRIWEHQSKQEQPLTPILPLVVYHGRSKWEIHPEFGALLSAPEEMRPYLPNFRYHVRDFSHLSDVEIKGEIVLRVLLMTMRNIHNPHFRDELRPFLRYLFQLKGEQVPSGLDYLYRVLYYISRYAKGVSRQDVYVALQTEREEGEEPYMTIAEEFIQEGFERGIVKGLERGRQEGLQKGRQETLREVVLRLAEKHSLVTISELLGLPIAEVVALAKEPEVGDDEETADIPPLAE